MSRIVILISLGLIIIVVSIIAITSYHTDTTKVDKKISYPTIDMTPIESLIAEKMQIIPQKQPMPDFAAIKDIPTLKQTFFSYLLPAVEVHNQNILTLRKKLLSNTLSTQEINALAGKYKTTPRELSAHIDVIPMSLVLAQAAIESNWGRSRFAKHNNFFGVWCFTKGCGVVPLKRSANATHEVAIFDSIEENIAYYLHMLNSHDAYAELRALRQKARKENLPLSGSELAKGLLNYSEIREKYISTVQKVIKYNNLSTHDTP